MLSGGRSIMVYAYFGGLGADKQAIYELLLEYCDLQYTVTAITRQYRLPQGTGAWHAFSHWLRTASGATATWQLYHGQEARLALRILFSAACAANLAEHGQRFCYALPSVPAQPGALAALLPAQLRSDGSLPIHPQLWQVGRTLNTLPVERHSQACMDGPNCYWNLQDVVRPINWPDRYVRILLLGGRHEDHPTHEGGL
jgi:hypothetical protein